MALNHYEPLKMSHFGVTDPQQTIDPIIMTAL
jgi:hypothetical protein